MAPYQKFLMNYLEPCLRAVVGDLRVEGGDDSDSLEEDDAVLGEEGRELVLLVKVQLGVRARRVVRAQGTADLWKSRT